MNKIGYFEIQVDDVEKARKFYTEVFDWKFIKEESFPIEYYRIEMAGIYGGLLKRPAKTPPKMHGTNAYVCSVQVNNFNETEEKILKNGGIVALEKFAVPGRCWQGYFLDTEGNTFGIFEVDEKAA
jgi:uncharacterized protein